LSKSTISKNSSKESVALQQQPVKFNLCHHQGPQVHPFQAESKGVGLGVLSVKEKT
jgi:hypothetical protein